jgi:hypothetical protein
MLTFIALRHQNMLLRQSSLLHTDVKRRKPHVHCAHGSLVDYDIFMSIKKTENQKKKSNSYGIWDLQK